MSAQFDTSGEVLIPHPTARGCMLNRRWPDLSPFVQRYIEALAKQFDFPGEPEVGLQSIAFSDLAPETLARIMEDCEAHRHWWRGRGSLLASDDTAANGADFWRNRNTGWPCLAAADRSEAPHRWLPLTPYLGDDGKVYLKESA